MDNRKKTEINQQKDVDVLTRDPAIELARLLGCLLVIGCHTVLNYQSGNIIDRSRLLMAMYLADGVAIFWLIGGAFLFDGDDYVKILVRSMKKVFIPMLFVGAIYFWIGDFFSEGKTLLDSIRHTKNDYLNVVRNFFRWRNGIADYGHTWYVYIYMLLMLIFPMLKRFSDYLEASKKRIFVFLAGTFAFLIINDVTRNELASFSHYSINGLVPAAIITLWGRLIYRKRQWFERKSMFFLSIGGFLCLNLMRVYIQTYRFEHGIGDGKSIMYWYSAPGLLCAICIVVFCMLCVKNRKATKINRFICYIGSYSFPIYLVHILIRNALRYYGVFGKLQHFFSIHFIRFWGDLGYTVVVIGIVYLMSFGVVWIVRRVRREQRRFWDENKSKEFV